MYYGDPRFYDCCSLQRSTGPFAESLATLAGGGMSPPYNGHRPTVQSEVSILSKRIKYNANKKRTKQCVIVKR